MKIPRNTIEKWICTAVCGAGLAGGALGETLPDAADGGGGGDAMALESIVVTARRTRLPLSEALANVTVIPAGEIMNSSANSVPDLLANLEGLYVEDASGVGTSAKLNLRGFTTGMSGHHLVLVDGIPQNSLNDKLVDWNLIPLSDIERIEVVRGPLSTLYGENAMSGVINILTREKTAAPETTLQGSYGSFDTVKGGARTSRTWDRTDYRFSLDWTSTDGYRDHADADYFHLSGQLGHEPDEDSRLSASVQYSEIERGAHPWTLSKAQIAEDREQARPGTEQDRGETRKLNSVLRYERMWTDSLSVRANGYFRNEDGESFYTSGPTTLSTAEILREESLYGMTLSGHWEPVLLDIPHTLVAGLDLERGSYDYDKYAAPGQVRAQRQSRYEAERDRMGLFLEDEMELVPGFRLLFGARHSRLEYDFQDFMNPERDQRRTLSENSLRAGATFAYRGENSSKASRGHGQLFASIARAFRSPTLGQMFTFLSANPDLEAETALHYEIGIREGIGEALALRMSLYWMDVKDEITYNYDSRGYENYGETNHRGIELGLNARLTAMLDLFVNYTYTDASHDSGPHDGRDLPHVQRHRGNLGLEYGKGSPWGGRLSARVIGSSYLDDANSARLPSYTTLDLRGWVEAGAFRLFAELANLLDEEYSTYGFLRGDKGYFSPAPGITFTTGVSATF